MLLLQGIISDADIESERLRALGGARFAVMGLFRILKLRSYRGRLSYLPADGVAAAAPASLSAYFGVLYFLWRPTAGSLEPPRQPSLHRLGAFPLGT